MQPESGVLEPVDGRTARRDRNRIAVLDAVLELFAERRRSLPSRRAGRAPLRRLAALGVPLLRRTAAT